MSAAPLHLAGERLMLDLAGALFWPAAGLLAVADLHLGKSAASAAQEISPVPRATLDRLVLLLRRWMPRIVLVLGEPFHDRAGVARLLAGEVARLRALIATHRLVWITDNHDPMTSEGLGGESARIFAAGPLVFRYRAVPGAVGSEISGHLHPEAGIPSRGSTMHRPCFVADARRVLLPAFGVYAGGLDVTDPAVTGLFPRGGRVFLLGQARLFSFPLAGGTHSVARGSGA